MSKLEVDQNLCIGCGLCESLCPQCFKLGEDGKSHVLKDACVECNLDEVAESCPVGAISYGK